MDDLTRTLLKNWWERTGAVRMATPTVPEGACRALYNIVRQQVNAISYMSYNATTIATLREACDAFEKQIPPPPKTDEPNGICYTLEQYMARVEPQLRGGSVRVEPRIDTRQPIYVWPYQGNLHIEGIDLDFGPGEMALISTGYAWCRFHRRHPHQTSLNLTRGGHDQWGHICLGDAQHSLIHLLALGQLSAAKGIFERQVVTYHAGSNDYHIDYDPCSNCGGVAYPLSPCPTCGTQWCAVCRKYQCSQCAPTPCKRCQSPVPRGKTCDLCNYSYIDALCTEAQNSVMTEGFAALLRHQWSNWSTRNVELMKEYYTAIKAACGNGWAALQTRIQEQMINGQ